MIERTSHNISKLTWNTSFDRKEKVRELQDRLSAWSRIKMPGEVANVFDKICISGQVWQIERLEVDLGPIDFNDLEHELNVKFYQQLSETLQQLILHPSQNSNHIEVFNENESLVYMVSHFLLYGLLPWSKKPGAQSADQIIAYLLQNENKAIIAMLREIGVTHLNVRKRIAWQVSESNIIKIIAGLEPNNHEQIIEFSDELTKIQAQENIVQAGLSDFKKSLWFWILNYLLTERGPVFNKIAFVKSNIRQMAGHYNISYEQLLAMIAQAVSKVEQSRAIKADIIRVLKTVVSESTATTQKTFQPGESEATLWMNLKNHFLEPLHLGSGYSNAEFNDLIVGLGSRDVEKFRELLISLESEGGLLSPAIAELNNASLEILFSAFCADTSIIYAESIYFLDTLFKELNLSVEAKLLWEAGLKFMLSKRDVSFTSVEYLDYIIAEISKQKQVSKLYILEKLLNTEVPHSAKTLAGIDVYTHLTDCFVNEVSREKTTFITQRLNEVLGLMDEQLMVGSVGKISFVLLQKLAAKYVRYSPGAALEVFVAYQHKESLRRVMPYILDNHLINLLVKHAKNEVSSIISSIQRINELGPDNEFSKWVNNKLPGIGLHMVVFQSELKAGTLLEYILKRLEQTIPTRHEQQFYLFIKALPEAGKMTVLGLSTGLINKIQQSLAANRERPVVETVRQFMNKPNEQNRIGKLLTANFSDKHFVQLRALKNSESNAILNYLLTSGVRLRDNLIAKHIRLLNTYMAGVSKDRIRHVLNELYWKCILNYSDHRGNSAILKRSFDNAVWFRFPGEKRDAVIESGQGYIPQAKDKLYSLKSGNKLPFSKLISLIEQCLTQNRAVISSEGKAYRLNELIVIGLEIQPDEVRRIIKNLPLSGERIKILRATIPFDLFSLLIANGTSGAVYEGAQTIRMLYWITARTATGQIPDKLFTSYWNLLLQLIRTGTLATNDLQTLVQDSMYYLIWDSKLDSEFIIAEIQKTSTRLTPELRSSFTEYNKAFSSLPSLSKTSISLKVERVKKKGMLYELAYHIIILKQLPPWLGRANEHMIKDMLNEIAAHHTENILLVLKHEIITESQILWFSQAIDFKTLTGAISDMNMAQQSQLENLERLYELLGRIVIKGISAKEMQLMVFRKLVKAWTTGNWKIISSEQIWNQLIWSANARYWVQVKEFVHAIEKVRSQLPAALQISFGYLKDSADTSIGVKGKPAVLKPYKNPLPKKELQALAKEGIPVRNAGLVLINSYLPVLFERLGITSNNGFVDYTAQLQAVHYLQYVVTGFSNTEESLLPLNKVICGVPLSQPVDSGIEISEDHIKMIEGLIEAMISHWPAIGASSVYGFRGNWLVRDGILTEQEDRWNLTVEKRPYDLLINYSPFSFSIIKHPWMDKPLHVSWQY